MLYRVWVAEWGRRENTLQIPQCFLASSKIKHSIYILYYVHVPYLPFDITIVDVPPSVGCAGCYCLGGSLWNAYPDQGHLEILQVVIMGHGRLLVCVHTLKLL